MITSLGQPSLMASSLSAGIEPSNLTEAREPSLQSLHL